MVNPCKILFKVTQLIDQETIAHSKRIMAYTKILAIEVMNKIPSAGIDKKLIEKMVEASSIHDIGKLFVPRSVLHKKTELNEAEYRIIKKHTINGGKIINAILLDRDDENYIYYYNAAVHHHERIDGGGYPDGWTKEQIPIYVQIISLADVYDALIHERCYHPAYSHEVATNMILNGTCGRFDDDLISCFLSASESLKQYNLTA